MREFRDRVLRAVSLVVTDRRWAAPLSAMALGFGLFLGIAIGPGATGSLATGAQQIIEVPGLAADDGGGDEGGGGSEPIASAGTGEESGEESIPIESTPETEFAPEPLVSEPAPEEEAEEPASEPAPEEEVEEEAETQRLQGTVVHANPAAGSYTMAIPGGELVSIHAPKLPLAGTKLTVEGSPLANNTFAEAERARSGAAARATFNGVVTFVDPGPADPAYTVSGRGSSILVHVAPAPTPQLPVLGAYVTAAVRIEKATPPEPAPTDPAASPGQPPVEPASACPPDPTLPQPPRPAKTVVQRQVKSEPEPTTYVDLAGIVSAICPATGQLLLSADDLRESEADVVLAAPERFKTSGLKLGDSVLATATIEEDGTLTLAGLASDERAKGAEDAGSAQGDLKR
ncbi:MAG: hypothetical protein WD810_00305 [Solirubrobacterales bacterium]